MIAKPPHSPSENQTRPNDPRFGERALEKIEQLATHTDVPGKVHRLFLSKSHRAAADQVAVWMRDAGCDHVTIDALGSVVGRYEGTNKALPPLLIGSHIDTVTDAGKYDGNLGVVAGLLVVEDLRRAGERLPFAVEVLAFGDEENIRFPTTLASSKALAGTFQTHWLDARDADGVSLREALVSYGGDPDAVTALKREPGSALAYLEVHIEQGPVLEAENLPVGIVSSIASIMRGRVTLTGEAGHAGTVPMRYRRDALACAAEMMSAMEKLAAAVPDAVATVGVLDVAPKAMNVIPGAVSFTIDVRAPADEPRRALVERIAQTFRDIAERRGILFDLDAFFDQPCVPCAQEVVEAFEASIASLGFKPRRLPSGAAHDAMAMEPVCPIGMLFVRCEKGISHNPAEFASVPDMDVAIRVLVDTVRHFAAKAG